MSDCDCVFEADNAVERRTLTIFLVQPYWWTGTQYPDLIIGLIISALAAYVQRSLMKSHAAGFSGPKALVGDA